MSSVACILEVTGQIVRAGRSKSGKNGRHDSFQEAGNSPRELSLYRPFQTAAGVLAPDWAETILCIILSNRLHCSTSCILTRSERGIDLTGQGGKLSSFNLNEIHFGVY